MTKAKDHHLLQSKCKAISVLLPYAVWQERDGKPDMFDAILHAIEASRMLRFVWYHVDQFVSTLLSEASPRAIVLMLPHIPWHRLIDKEDLAQQWVATASAIPYTEEVAQGVVDTVLQIASEGELVPFIPVDLWSWLTKCPPLPPICRGRFVGSRTYVINAVRALKDVEVLKSYLLLVWSELDNPEDSDTMCTSIREDLGGIEMGRHRADLVQWLDHVLGELDLGLEHLNQVNPRLGKYHLREAKRKYGELKEVLLEVDRCTSSPLTVLSAY